MDLNKHYFCNFSFSFVSKFHGGVSKITKMYSFEPRRLVSDQNRAHLCEHEAGRGAAGGPRPPPPQGSSRIQSANRCRPLVGARA